MSVLLHERASCCLIGLLHERILLHEHILLHAPVSRCMSRVGQNRISAPYMTVCMVFSLLKIPYVHRKYV
jgi:hypothetical protein